VPFPAVTRVLGRLLGLPVVDFVLRGFTTGAVIVRSSLPISFTASLSMVESDSSSRISSASIAVVVSPVDRR
jgi:hypothetical protein